jgi:hypothetical protein
MPAKTPRILLPLYERMRQDIILGGLAARISTSRTTVAGKSTRSLSPIPL